MGWEREQFRDEGSGGRRGGGGGGGGEMRKKRNEQVKVWIEKAMKKKNRRERKR